jgi:hypothetical protein
MGTPTSMTPPDPSTLTQDSGGAPLPPIQDFLDTMGPDTDLGIDQVTPILILAISPADRFLLRADQVPVPHHQRMLRHECLSVAEATDSSGLFIDTFSRPMLASPLRAG